MRLERPDSDWKRFQSILRRDWERLESAGERLESAGERLESDWGRDWRAFGERWTVIGERFGQGHAIGEALGKAPGDGIGAIRVWLETIGERLESN